MKQLETNLEQYVNQFIFYFTHYLSLLFRKFTSKFCVNYKEIRKNLEFEVMELDAIKMELKLLLCPVRIRQGTLRLVERQRRKNEILLGRK